MKRNTGNAADSNKALLPKAAALIIPFISCALQWLFWEELQPFVWFLFFPTVFLSAWLGGMFGAVCSAITSAALVWYVFIPPQLSWTVNDPHNIYSVVMFVGMGCLFGLVFTRLERAKQQLQDSNNKISALYEKTKEIDTLKTQFFANVSHELRTPLALIAGPISSWLNNNDFNEQTRRELEIVDRNARLLQRQVNDLLDVAKLEAGRMTMRYVQTDLAYLIRLIASHFTIVATERSIDFSVEAETTCSAWIDIDKFQRIAMNLLSNAFKFTPDHGAVRVALRSSGGQAILSVQDTGRGIPKESHDVIFESFRQIDGNANREFGGTGLGLSIVKEFSLLHGGSVHVENVPEGGARFIVTLPVSQPAGLAVPTVDDTASISLDISTQLVDELRTQKVPSFTTASSHTGRFSVLVVEDNTDMNYYICSTLQPHYRVLSAYNGQEGLAAALDHKPDLIISDIMMPGLSGDAMFTEIRSYPELSNIPIIILTAKADDDLQIKMLKLGVHDYIRKPFLPAELLARVSNILMERSESDNNLHEEEGRFAALVEASPIGIFKTDCDGRCTFVNDRWCEITGISHDGALGEGWTATLHPDDRQNVFDTWNASITNNETFKLEYRFQVQNSDVRWVYGQAVSMTDPSGKITGYIGTITDITDRKQAEMKLNNAYELMRYIIEHNRSAIAVHDRDLNYIYVSERYLRDYGIKDKDIVGRHHYEVLPDIPQKWRDVHQKALSGIVSAADCDSYLREDGTQEWTRWECRPWYEADGGIGGIIIYTELITERKRAEEELRSAKKRLEAMLNAIPDLMFRIDQEGRVHEFHYSSADITHPALAAGKNITELLSEDASIIVMNALSEAKAKGSHRGAIYSFHTPQGMLWFELSISAMGVSDRTGSQYIMLARDITARKNFEDELKNSLLRFQTMLHVSPVPVALNDYHGNITYTNPAFTKTFGYVSEEIPTLQQWWELAYPDPGYRASVIETWVKRLEIANQNGTVFQPLQVKIRCKNGAVKTVIADAAPSDARFYNEYLVVLFDISDRLELQNIETTLSTIFRTSPDVIAVSEKNSGKFIEVNNAFEKVIGYTREEAVGKTSSELGTWGDIKYRQEMLDAFNKDHFLSNFKTMFRRKNGEVFPALISLSAVVLNETECLVFSARDITDYENILNQLREAKVVAESASLAKSQFLATMSHEIRTPMNGIIGMAQLLQMTQLTEEQKEYTDFITLSGKNLSNLITDILDLSRIEAGGVELENCDFSLSNTVTNITSIFTLLAEGKGLTFNCRIDPDVPHLLTGDGEHLRQIISNLIGNAIKFTSEGSVTLHISKDDGDEHQTNLRFAVSDSGIGIAPDVINKIFDPFTQADSSTSRRFGGSGLGLTIARHLVELMGGTLSVESHEGVGTTFWFTVAFKKQKRALVPPAIEQVEQASDLSISAVNEITILLVEDDPANQYAISRLLSKTGYRVDIAANGSEGLKMLEEKDYALVLMDCMMPVMDGYEATAAIRNPASKVTNHAIPVIAVSAHVLKEARDKCLAAGMDDFISKPVEYPVMIAMLEKWIKIK